MCGDRLIQVYRDVGKLVGSSGANIALTANATDAYARALSSIPFERGDVIIGAWSEYASNQIQFLSLAKRFGVELVRAPQSATGAVDLDALGALIRQRSPKLVASVHMNTSNGLLEDVAAIGAICRRHDVFYLVDGCQTVGQLPIDVHDIGCDFFSATSRKYLRGPRGAGFLYVSDRALSAGLEPLFPDLRGAKLIDHIRYSPVGDAKRFEDWESPVANLLGLGEAARFALELGLEDIRDRVWEISDHLRERLDGFSGWRVIDRGDCLGPIIPIFHEGVNGEKVHSALTANGINTNFTPADWAPMDEYLSTAGWAIRVSPHYYNAPGDIDRLCQGLEDLR